MLAGESLGGGAWCGMLTKGAGIGNAYLGVLARGKRDRIEGCRRLRLRVCEASTSDDVAARDSNFGEDVVVSYNGWLRLLFEGIIDELESDEIWSSA
ncbi:uncharacterized protein A4U43_C07F25330 [Asparagus officinalis]|uniref:Uncharacterized protein n=1 Tax=Asparagus officinalis TaxID=4686 RepID=A0A5P1EF39_ASPOF|nr:uncharacterized protein A4U43_C07F25330 [Asparagus officinalis]